MTTWSDKSNILVIPLLYLCWASHGEVGLPHHHLPSIFSLSPKQQITSCYFLFGPAPILILGVLVLISQFLVLACSPFRPWNHWGEQSSLFSRKFYIWSQVSTFRSNEMFACLDIFSDAWIPAVFQVCLPSAADELVLRAARSSEAKPTLTSPESLCLSCSTRHMLPAQ